VAIGAVLASPPQVRVWAPVWGPPHVGAWARDPHVRVSCARGTTCACERGAAQWLRVAQHVHFHLLSIHAWKRQRMLTIPAFDLARRMVMFPMHARTQVRIACMRMHTRSLFSGMTFTFDTQTTALTCTYAPNRNIKPWVGAAPIGCIRPGQRDS
jgi:hypothetical protein